jgi:hypothetical protein
MIFSVIPAVASSMILLGTPDPRHTPSHGSIEAGDDGWLKYPMMTPSPRLTANTTEISRISLTLVQGTSLLTLKLDTTIAKQSINNIVFKAEPPKPGRIPYAGKITNYSPRANQLPDCRIIKRDTARESLNAFL